MTTSGVRHDPRVAVVTGAFGGIGAGICRRLVSAGYHVLAVGRTPRDQESVISPGGTGAMSDVVTDITDPDAPGRVVDRALAEFGRMQVLVHCAGVLGSGSIDVVSETDFRRVIDVNLLSAMRLTGTALPHLRAAGDGRVVTVGSRSWLGMSGASTYSSSKGGLIGMTRSLALSEGRHGVTANAIAPGYVATRMTTHMTGQAAPRIPVGRGGEPEDIARAVEFFAAPEAGYITGQTMLVCGGRGLVP